MSAKSKGIKAEREIIKLFAETGTWLACRVAGSGSSPFPAPDIIAGNELRKIALECKTLKKGKKYLDQEEVEQLKIFAERFGAEAWLAMKFGGRAWSFLKVEDLEKTGNGFAISQELSQKKGLSFELLIQENQKI